MTSKTKIAIGILGAVAAGAVIGLLLAPEKGTEIRKKIKNTATDWVGYLVDLFAAGKAELDEMKDGAIKGANELQGEASKSINRMKENFS